MKKLFFLLCISVLAIGAQAQQYLGTNGPSYGSTPGVGGAYQSVLNGGTNTLAGSAAYTNAITLPCASHPNVGLDLNYNCLPGATNGNIIVTVARSYDNGASFETTPHFNLTNALPTALQFAAGQTNFTVEFDLPVTNTTVLEIVDITNTAASGIITNLSVGWNLNAPAVWFIPAQY